MYERIDLPNTTLVGVRIKDDISKPENQEIVHLIQRCYQQNGSVRLLVDYEADPGLMGAEGLYDNMRFARQTAEYIDRMAVIGNYDWESTWIGLFGLFGGIRANYYDRSEVENALIWLKQ